MTELIRYVIGVGVMLLVAPGLLADPGDERRTSEQANRLVIVPDPVHLRSGTDREWDTFPLATNREALEASFSVDEPAAWHALRWQQEDVRRRWQVSINDEHLIDLAEDETRIATIVSIPPGLLRKGVNVLSIASVSDQSDDVLVGPVLLLSEVPDAVLSQAGLDLEVRDETGLLVPARITIVDEQAALAPLRAPHTPRHAIRTGVVYTATGKANISLASGTYTVFASRGAEYEADSLQLNLAPGEQRQRVLRIRRSVLAEGYVGIDTHVHTLEWSFHGDASVAERLVTLVGEGLGGAVLTEHNMHASLAPAAAAAGVAEELILIPGNEYSTPVGHFNVFPVEIEEDAPSADVASWQEVRERIREVSDARIVTLNHGRDVHAGFVPLGVDRFSQLSGERLDGAVLPSNAMEVWNSSAQLRDPFALLHDWMGMVNRGEVITPVGSSDSHDVSRYAIGQGRTYVRCGRCGSEAESMDEVIRALEHGSVLPSMGLLTDVFVNGESASGRLIKGRAGDEIVVRVWGPSWMPVDYVALYRNGRRVRVAPPQNSRAAGLKGEWHWPLSSSEQDVALVAVAWGKAPDTPFWRIPKPYQRKSDRWTPHVAGASGLIRVDVDGDGAWSSAREYAKRLTDTAGVDLSALFSALNEYDAAVATQVASLLRDRGLSLDDPSFTLALSRLDPDLARSVSAYLTTR